LFYNIQDINLISSIPVVTDVFGYKQIGVFLVTSPTTRRKFMTILIISAISPSLQLLSSSFIFARKPANSMSIHTTTVNLNMKISVILFFLATLFLISCNSGPTENTGINRKTSDSDSTFNLCYSSFVKKDTVLFNALVYGDSIKGSLGYKLYEKQQDNGLLLGKMVGDTIWGLYTFMSADSEFVNEVTFLRVDTLLIEGLGDRVLKNGKFVFADKSKIRYAGVKLAKNDCKQTSETK
jgi:hypothetical protein